MDEDSFALISAPIPDGEQLEEQEVCRIYPVTGQLGTVRKDGTSQRTFICAADRLIRHISMKIREA